MPGKRKDTTQAVVDGLLKFLLAGGIVTTVLAAPNAVQIFDKPLDKIFKDMNKRSRERELRRIMHYMKRRGLITYKPNDYEHGILITDGGKKYLKHKKMSDIVIQKPDHWDKKWRLVFFDIPENKKVKRQSLTAKLRLLGFQTLQYSVWIHPFACRTEIEAVTEMVEVSRFVTYVEIDQIDNANELQVRFEKLLK